ncbi:hypothetical protein ACFWBC_26675 [Streptomyces sp. NPDC059985]|uniref:hypothetical protein n=1 Tax=Streptomyces sp. NPDC059985 TaxID=3347025 RepID=UPI00368FEDC3
MGLLVEARRLSALGPEGLLFTSVSGTITDGDLAVITGPPQLRRTALMLALSGRFAISGGALATEGEKNSTRRAQAALRSRVCIAQAPPALQIDARMRVGEVLAERRLVCGRKNMSADSFWDAFELMELEKPAKDEAVWELEPLEKLLLSVALCYAQHTDAIAVADIDAGLGTEDRHHVRRALGQIVQAGRTVIATSADTGWGTAHIALEEPPPPPPNNPKREKDSTPVHDSRHPAQPPQATDGDHL